MVARGDDASLLITKGFGKLDRKERQEKDKSYLPTEPGHLLAVLVLWDSKAQIPRRAGKALIAEGTQPVSETFRGNI